MRMTYLVALVAALLAGCGNNGESADNATAASSGASPATQADPCSLLTAEEVAAVTGDKVTGANADGNTCTYATDDADGVQVEYYASGGKAEMETAKSAAEVMGKMGDAVAGGSGAGNDVAAMLNEGGKASIGDAAFFGPNSQLSVVKGDAYVAITPPIMHSRISYQGNPLISAEDKRKMALQLAQKALAKLP